MSEQIADAIEYYWEMRQKEQRFWFDPESGKEKLLKEGDPWPEPPDDDITLRPGPRGRK